MKAGINNIQSKLNIAVLLLLVSAGANSSDLNPVEKQTVSLIEGVSKNGQVQNTAQKVKNLEQDSIYLDSHERENVVAYNSDRQTDGVVNSLGKQFLKALLGSYKDEIKNAWLSLDLSNDEQVSPSEIEVSSYDRHNFELVMQARKHKKASESDTIFASTEKVEKGRWKLRPRIGSSNGAILNYYTSKFNLEMRITNSEQGINVHRNLKDLAMDVFYNVNLKDDSSSLTLSKPVAENLNLQVQKVGRGVSAFTGSEDRISLNFGRAF